MKHSLCMVAIVAIGMFLVGCIPGESELTIKTSEFNKAMRGEVAEIMVKVESIFERTPETAIKNIDDKVSVGISGIETGRDFARFLARVCSNAFRYSERIASRCSKRIASGNENKPLRNAMTINVRDIDVDMKIDNFFQGDKEVGDVVMKMVASYPASLTRSGVLVRDEIDEKDSMPILCLDVNPTNGTLHISDLNMASNETFFFYQGCIRGIFMMLDKLKIVDLAHESKGEDKCRLIAEQVACLVQGVHLALEVDYVTFVIEGDDDKPVLVVGKEVKVNNKRVANYRAWIRKGDKVRIEANAKMTGNGVRFFETEAQADAAEPIEHK